MRKRRSPSASLERQVILAVVILYLFISAAMIAMHYAFAGQPTATSSTSPSHDDGAGAAEGVRP